MFDDLRDDTVDEDVTRHAVHGGHTQQAVLVANDGGIHHQLVKRLRDVHDAVVVLIVTAHAGDGGVIVGLCQFVVAAFKEHGGRLERRVHALNLVVLIGCHRLTQVVDGLAFVAFAEGQLGHGVVDAVAIVLVVGVAEHLVHHLVEFLGVVGRAHLGHIHARLKLHLVFGVALDDFLELRRGALRIALVHIDLSQDEHGAGAQVAVVVEQQTALQVTHGVVVVLHGDKVVGNGEVDVAHQLLGRLRHASGPGLQLLDHGYCLGILLGLDVGFDEPHIGHIGDVVVVVFGGNEVKGSLGGDVVVFIEMRLAHDEIGVIDPSHTLAAAELHRVFLHADGSLLKGAVHGGVHRRAVLLCPVVVDTEHLSIVVLHSATQLLVALLKALLAIEIDVIVAGQIMVHATGEGVLLGGASAQHQGQHTAYRHEYVSSSMHFVVVLQTITPKRPNYYGGFQKASLAVGEPFLGLFEQDRVGGFGQSFPNLHRDGVSGRLELVEQQAVEIVEAAVHDASALVFQGFHGLALVFFHREVGHEGLDKLEAVFRPVDGYRFVKRLHGIFLTELRQSSLYLVDLAGEVVCQAFGAFLLDISLDFGDIDECQRAQNEQDCGHNGDLHYRVALGDGRAHLADAVVALFARELGAMRGHSAKLLRYIAFADELHDLAQRIDVGAVVDILALDDLGGHKLHLLDEQFAVGILFRLGHAEVDETGTAVVGGHQDVLGAEVAVHDAVAVEIIQGLAHFSEDALHLFLGEGAHTHMFGQRLALDVFEDDAVAQAFDLNEIKRLADIFIVEYRGGIILLTQRCAASLIFSTFFLQCLDNDLLTIEFGRIDPAIAIA